MPQFNFQERFAADVESGRKRQTVRHVRRNTPKVGQTAHLFTGLRTKAARCLGRHSITDVRPILVDMDGSVSLGETGDPDAYFHGRDLSPSEADAFAEADGFENAVAFVAWIRDTHGLPFEGHVTSWDPSA